MRYINLRFTYLLTYLLNLHKVDDVTVDETLGLQLCYHERPATNGRRKLY